MQIERGNMQINEWTRFEIKRKAKACLSKYYWKCVLVGFLLLIFGQGCNSAGGLDNLFANFPEDSSYSYDAYDDYNYGYGYDTYDDYGSSFDNDESFLVVIIILITLVCAVIAWVLNLLVFNPLLLGITKFWLQTTRDDCNVSYLGYGFKNNYWNVVKTYFLLQLKLFLWSLLFIIPGIIKTYEYFMVTYILAENPAIDSSAAFDISKQCMSGQKWRVFVLVLSFIGWFILGVISCGLVNIFYVIPYFNLTLAVLADHFLSKINANSGSYRTANFVSQEA